MTFPRHKAMANRETAAVIMTLFATFFWGSTFHAAVLALSSLPPWTAAFARFVIAIFCTFALLSLREGIRWRVLSRNFIPYLTLGLIGVAGFAASLFVGLQTASPLTAALIMATTPISANIIEALVHRQGPGLARIAGMVVSLFGVFLVITRGEILYGEIDFVFGDLLILGGSIAWAIYTVGVKSAVKDATPLATTAWTMLSGAIALGIAAILLESPAAAIREGSAISFVSLVWLGVACTVLAYLFWNVGTVVRGSGRTAIFFNLIPIFALLIELARGTVPGTYQLAGIAITIFGVLLGQGRLRPNQPGAGF